MKPRRVIQKIAITLIVLSVVVLVGLTIYQRQQIKKLSTDGTPGVALNDSAAKESSSASIADSRQRAVASAKNKPGAGRDTEDLQYQLDSAEEELNMAQEDLSEELDKKAELRNSMIELQRQQLQNPATRNLIRNTMKTSFQNTYGPLFGKLALSDEKQEAFLELLADQQMETMDLYTQIYDTSLSGEERKALEEQNEALIAKNDAVIADFLGSGNSEIYLDYKEKLQERQTLAPFLDTLGAEDKLTESQQEALIDAMYEGRKAAEEELPFEKRMLSPTDLNEEEMARVLEVYNGRNAAYLKSADAVLTESQAEQFKIYLEQQRQMQEASLRMASGLFGE